MKKRYLIFPLALCLLFSGCGNRKDPAGTPDGSPDAVPAVSDRALWNEGGREGFYNYCPSFTETAEGVRYVYYCTNTKPFAIVDHIACRRAEKNGAGEWVYGAETVVLSPTAGAWDARHVCDPSVIAGDFTYGGTRYGYLMAYLGCTSEDNQNNKIGLAVAEAPEGPFRKIGEAPFVDFTPDPAATTFQWGVGQPSLINRATGGTVWLFYTRGDVNGTRVLAEEWDLSDLENPRRIGSVQSVSAKGLVNLDGKSDFLNNADFVYDVAANTFYCVSDCHPNPTDAPAYIASHFRVTAFPYEGAFLNAKQREVAVISPAETGFARNHNTGVLRDVYGHFAGGNVLTVCYTSAAAGEDSLWSYRLRERTIPLG